MDESRTLGVGLFIHLRLTHIERENFRRVLMVRIALSMRIYLHPAVSALMDEFRTLGVGLVIHLRLTHIER